MNGWTAFSVTTLSLGLIVGACGDMHRAATVSREIAVLQDQVHDLIGRVQRLEGVDIDQAVKIGPQEVCR